MSLNLNFAKMTFLDFIWAHQKTINDPLLRQSRIWINLAPYAHKHTIMLVLLDAKAVESQQKSVWSSPVRRKYLLILIKAVITLCWHGEIGLVVVKVPPVKIFLPLLFFSLQFPLNQFFLLLHDFFFYLWSSFHEFLFLLGQECLFIFNQICWILNNIFFCLSFFRFLFLVSFRIIGILLLLLFFFLFVVVIFRLFAFFFFCRFRTPLLIWFLFIVFATISRPKPGLLPNFYLCWAIKYAIFHIFLVFFANLLYYGLSFVWLFPFTQISPNQSLILWVQLIF